MKPPHATNPSKRPQEGERSQSQNPASNTLPTQRSSEIHQHDVFVSTLDLASRPRRRRAFNEGERLEVAAVREIGACHDCRRRKVKCFHARSYTQSLQGHRKQPKPQSVSRSGTPHSSLDGTTLSSEDSNTERSDSAIDSLNSFALDDPFARYIEDRARYGNPVPWLLPFLPESLEWRTRDGIIEIGQKQAPASGFESRVDVKAKLLHRRKYNFSSYAPTHGSESLTVFPIRKPVPGENRSYRLATGIESTQPIRTRRNSLRKPRSTSHRRPRTQNAHHSSHQQGLQVQQSPVTSPSGYLSNMPLSHPYYNGPGPSSLPHYQSLGHQASPTAPLPSPELAFQQQIDYLPGQYTNSDFEIANSMTMNYSLPTHYEETPLPPQHSFSQVAPPYPQHIPTFYTDFNLQQQQITPRTKDDNYSPGYTSMMHNNMLQPPCPHYSQVTHNAQNFENQSNIQSQTQNDPTHLTPYDYANFYPSSDNVSSSPPSLGFRSSSMLSTDVTSNRSHSASFLSSSPQLGGSDVSNGYTAGSSLLVGEEGIEAGKPPFSWQDFLNDREDLKSEEL